MKGRKQNKPMRLDQSESRVKPKSMIGLQTCMGISETGFTDFTRPKYRLLEFILSSANLNAAYKKMNSNTGIGGITAWVQKTLPYLREYGSGLVGSIREGTYKPNSFLRVEIPEANGKKRGLGISMIVDRVVYQGINLVLEAFYEFQFSETSYDFRLHCGAHQEWNRWYSITSVPLNSCMYQFRE